MAAHRAVLPPLLTGGSRLCIQIPPHTCSPLRSHRSALVAVGNRPCPLSLVPHLADHQHPPPSRQRSGRFAGVSIAHAGAGTPARRPVSSPATGARDCFSQSRGSRLRVGSTTGRGRDCTWRGWPAPPRRHAWASYNRALGGRAWGWGGVREGAKPSRKDTDPPRRPSARSGLEIGGRDGRGVLAADSLIVLAEWLPHTDRDGGGHAGSGRRPLWTR